MNPELCISVIVKCHSEGTKHNLIHIYHKNSFEKFVKN